MIEALRKASQQAVDRFQSTLHTSEPAVILRIDHDAMTVDVQPIIKRLYEDGTSEESPTILSVPIMMPGTQESLISLPVKVGDSVMLMYAQKDMDQWSISDSNQPTAAATQRTFDAQDAVAIPGLYSSPRSLNRTSIRKWPLNHNDLVMTMNIGTGSEVQLALTQTGNVLISTDNKVHVQSKEFLVDSETVTINANTAEVTAQQTTVNGDATVNGNANMNGNVTITGDTTISGILTLAGINMNTHVHPGVMAGPSVTAGPQ